ncbi:4-hydroxy-tetrahydrodipicolinate synthase [Pseudonocardiaceae bacterium YIM PH 21723]|nr:4-hydroxy-tetrahydrodipicolinate synthase [Pseudonocardiaceae bacterium YIM PH 21723]
MTSLTGIHVPLITPFTAEGTVATEALAGLAHKAADAGAVGLVALGTTAEVATLDHTERAMVIDVCASVSRERGLRLTVGAGGSDTRASAQALQDLTQWPDIDSALIPVPMFSRPGEAGVLAHFTHLATHSPLPLIVYHIPYRTGQQLSGATLRAIGELPGIAAVKYSNGAIDTETIALLGDLPADFAVLAGDDSFVSPLLALGASGGILASAHLATESFVDLVTAWRDGEAGRARELGARLARLSATLFAEPNPTVIKGVLHATGEIPTADVRLPLLPASQDSVDQALKALAEAGV